MRSKRAICINNSLVHGICNCDCILCSVNKPSYRGPKEYQDLAVTEAVIGRVLEAAGSRLRVRHVANSGDGEPTLHPDFAERMRMFGRLTRDWKHDDVPAPEITVVTNGQRLLLDEVIEPVVDADILLHVSFPTSHPEHYGQIMYMKPERGEETLERASAGIEKALKRGARLAYHVSPPYQEYVRPDFAGTVDYLSRLHAAAGRDSLRLVIFPATANRGGVIRHQTSRVDMFNDLFRRYNGRKVNGVRVELLRSLERFYPRRADILDLISAFNAPCIWYGVLFITAGGDSCCCNDQSALDVQGNVKTHSLRELMELRERRLPGAVCRACDQAPGRMKGGPLVKLYGLLADMKTRRSERRCKAAACP